MSERKPPPSLKDLDARLKKARGERADVSGPDKGGIAGGGSGLGLALRIGIELIAALVVGAGIGYFLDQWLGTMPWLMVVFFVLGAVAGIMNVFRTMSGLDGGVGFGGDRGRGPAKDADGED